MPCWIQEPHSAPTLFWYHDCSFFPLPTWAELWTSDRLRSFGGLALCTPLSGLSACERLRPPECIWTWCPGCKAKKVKACSVFIQRQRFFSSLANIRLFSSFLTEFQTTSKKKKKPAKSTYWEEQWGYSKWISKLWASRFHTGCLSKSGVSTTPPSPSSA